MKRPVILEGGTARNFNVKKLYVRPGSGDTLIPFVPEDEVALTTKSITENGVYQAKKEGVYGWSSVKVSVPKNTSVTGKGQDGKDHTITKDPVTGELVDEIAPEYIVVTMPPTTVQYQHGDTIDFSGIVVHAYDSDGVDLGEVPFEELIFPVTIADFYASGDIIIHDPQGINMIRLSKTGVVDLGGWGRFAYDSRVIGKYIGTGSGSEGRTGRDLYVGNDYENDDFSVYMTAYNGKGYFMAADEDSVKQAYVIIDYNLSGGLYGTIGTAQLQQFTICADDPNNPTWDFSGLPVSTIDPLEADMSAYDKAVQEIPVQWPRTGDGAVLEASFVIYVSPVAGGGGQAGGGAGRT